MAYGEHGAEHGPSFADALLGVELAAGYTGHSVSLADATTAAIVIQSVFGHDGGFPPHASRVVPRARAMSPAARPSTR